MPLYFVFSLIKLMIYDTNKNLESQLLHTILQRNVDMNY